MIGKTTIIAAVLALSCSTWAVAQLPMPVDADAIKQAEAAVRDAQQDGNSAATIRAYRRWLEFYPNEPSIQIGIYRAVATTFEQEGDAEQTKAWNGAADSLDPMQGGTTEAIGAKTRGAADKLTAILVLVNQSAQTVQAMRQSFNSANPRPATAGPGQMPTAFPPQTVGSPGYQPTPVTQPMPGYAQQPQFVPPTGPASPAPQFIGQQGQPQPIPLDAQGNPIPQPVPQPMQPMAVGAQGNPVPQPIQPVQQPQPQQVQYAQQQPQPQPVQPYPQQQAQPMQQYPQQQPQPQQGQYAQRQPQPQVMQQYPQQQPQRPQQYAQQRSAPYGASAGYARPQQTRRGDAAQSIRVFHDHSRLGDTNYFEPPCGALLLAENGSLTFTPTGGEAPLVIPASEIMEIRMNTAVAKMAGAFHIITKKGLYLGLAPQGETADEGRADVDELRRQLGLNQ